MKKLMLIFGISFSVIIHLSSCKSSDSSSSKGLYPGGITKHYKAVLDKNYPVSYGKKQNAEVEFAKNVEGIKDHYIITTGQPYPPYLGNTSK